MIFNTKTAAVTLAIANWASAQTLRQGQEIIVPVPGAPNSNASAPIDAAQPPPEVIVEPPATTVIDDAAGVTLDFTTTGILTSSAIEGAPSPIFETTIVEVVSSSVESSSVVDQATETAETSSVVDLVSSSVDTVEAIASSSVIVVESSALPAAETSSVPLNETSSVIAESTASSVESVQTSVPVFPNATVTEAVTQVQTSLQVSTIIQVETLTQVLDNNITVTNVVTNEQTITAPPGPPATETVSLVSTQIINQPTVIIVQQVTFFVFQSGLGGICPAVQPAPAPPAVPGQPAPLPGQGGFIVGGQTFPQFQQACLAACNIQLNQCQSIIGNGIQLTQCQSQFIACQGAAATATVTVSVPTTITQTVILPPEAVQTDAPAVTSKIIEGGGQVITTTVLASDAVATVGTGGVSIVTVTATPAPPAAPAPSKPPVAQQPPVKQPPQPITSVITVTMGNPGQPPIISTATITLQQPPASQEAEAQQPHTSVVTITMGQQTGVITMTVPAAHPTGANGCQICQAPVTVTETRVLTETVSFCPPQAATEIITQTVIASESVVPSPPPAAPAPPEKGAKHRFESYFDSRRKRSLGTHRRP